MNMNIFQNIEQYGEKKEFGVGKVLVAYILHEHKHLLFLANNSEWVGVYFNTCWAVKDRHRNQTLDSVSI